SASSTCSNRRTTRVRPSGTGGHHAPENGFGRGCRAVVRASRGGGGWPAVRRGGAARAFGRPVHRWGIWHLVLDERHRPLSPELHIGGELRVRQCQQQRWHGHFVR